jgi:hypothetical protein
MFFNLADGSRVKAKATKRGQYVFGVSYYAEFPASIGPNAGGVSGFYGVASQHLTLKAAEAARDQFLKDSPHAVTASVVEAG